MRLERALPLLLAAACASDPTGPSGADASVNADATAQGHPDATTSPGMDATVVETPDATVAPGLARSEKARVRWKGQSLLAAQLSTALSLPADGVWRELGRYDGFGVHRIALGGVEPYTLGINEPFPDTAVTAPLAIERMALGGCTTRVDQDLAAPQSAVLFGGVTADAAGDAERRAVVDRLYARVLSRRASDEEAKALVDLYGEVTAANEPRPGRAWSILSCFAVATSIEALFY